LNRRDFIATASAGLMIGGLPTKALALATDTASTGGKLGALRAVTIAAPSLNKIEKAYAECLGYHTVWRTDDLERRIL
jgi:hypothetical protein